MIRNHRPRINLERRSPQPLPRSATSNVDPVSLWSRWSRDSINFACKVAVKLSCVSACHRSELGRLEIAPSRVMIILIIIT